METVSSEVGNDPDVILANHKYRMAMLLVNAFTAAVLLVGMAFLYRANDIATEQRDRLVECTTPGNACYDDGQARTGEAVAQIIDEIIKDHENQTQNILEQLRGIPEKR